MMRPVFPFTIIIFFSEGNEKNITINHCFFFFWFKLFVQNCVDFLDESFKARLFIFFMKINQNSLVGNSSKLSNNSLVFFFLLKRNN